MRPSAPVFIGECRAAVVRITAKILLLPEQERLVFTLYYYERLKTQEIKELLGASDSSIFQLHASALAHLDANLANRAEGRTVVAATSGETIH
jgi:DNA-directed RNA polymerase specialized sigma24 family protein